MLLVQGPHFANHCSKAEDSCEALAANTHSIWDRRSGWHLLQVLTWHLPPKAHTRAKGLAHRLRPGRLLFLDQTRFMISCCFPVDTPHLQPKHFWSIPIHLSLTIWLQGKVLTGTCGFKEVVAPHYLGKYKRSPLQWVESPQGEINIWGQASQTNLEIVWCLFLKLKEDGFWRQLLIS